ncbi:uncharacterized protein DMENIID0001_007580 [Sergentomyia squamirostris]
MADADLSKMKVADLKRELKNRGLSTTGNKNELQERLQVALIDSDPVLEDTAISEDLDEDEVLNDDELEHAKELLEETSHEDVFLASPTPPADSTTVASKSSNLSAKEEAPAPKKIVLKRKLIIPIPSDPEATAEKDSLKDSASESDGLTPELEKFAEKDGDSEKKVIKLSELSAKERLELRMKKFGSPLSGDAKKIARAERFGTTTSSKLESNGNPASLDILKKRAERFGVSVSTEMSKIENDEKMKKRQERFGVAGKISVSSTAKSEYEAKAQQRLERFKPTVK